MLTRALSDVLFYCVHFGLQASVATEDGLVGDDNDFNDDDTATYALSGATSTVS
jgi:hypothetical protein